MPLRLTVIVCAHNEERYLPACLHSVLAQTRPPDELIVIDNASDDATAQVARAIPGVRVVTEPRKGLVIARERGRLESSGDVLVYLDADCRAPLRWLERVEREYIRTPSLVGLSGPYRYYDWDWWGRTLVRAYDLVVAHPTHVLVRMLGWGAVFYGGNFSARRVALERIGGFDTRIVFHGEDTNLGRRLAQIGPVRLAERCYLFTSARRYRALGKGRVFRLYIRNFVSEILHHRPKDDTYADIRS